MKLKCLAQIILITVLLVNLCGCGQSGALYLPTKTKPAQPNISNQQPQAAK